MRRELISIPSRYSSPAREVRVQLGTLEASVILTAIFMSFVLSHVIEHVHDPLALLRAIRRVMVPGGRLFCATPTVRAGGTK